MNPNPPRSALTLEEIRVVSPALASPPKNRPTLVSDGFFDRHTLRTCCAEGERPVQQVEEMAKRRYVCDFEIAQVYTVLGKKDQAFRWLDQGKKQQCDCLVWLQSEPWMGPLRVDPRYVDLVKRVFGRAPESAVP